MPHRAIHPKRRLLTVAACAALVAAAGCGSSDEAASTGGATASAPVAEPVEVVASTTQIADFARQVGGEDAEVTQILQPNSDPHDYEPRPDDIAAVADADLVLTSGDHIDEWMDEVVENAGGSPTVVVAGEGRPVELEGGEHEEEEGEDHAEEEHDPHWWHDPANASYAVERIRDAMVDVRPDARRALTDRAAAYAAQLATLDAGIEECIGRIPADARKLVTDHDAFAYFANRYDIEVVGALIPSQTTQAQPSAGDLDALADTIEREGVQAVFAESSLSPKLVTAIAEQTGASADYTLYADTLGTEDSDGATYLASEQANAEALARGFSDGEQGCPIRGL